MKAPILRFHIIGHYPPKSIRTRWVADSRPRIAEIESRIEAAWQEAVGRRGIKLFDGPMCRLEAFVAIGRPPLTPALSPVYRDERDDSVPAAGEILSLDFSRTSYKIFLGTNLTHPHWADQFGWAALANPVGVSSALQSSDGWLMLGRRNASVAYYPNRIHPFAGALEPSDPLDVFAQVRRELAEELSFTSDDVGEIICLGLVEDISLRQPELIFQVKSTRSRAEIEAGLDAAEHSDVVAIAAAADAVGKQIADPLLTPVGAASLLLFGRQRWGIHWFNQAAKTIVSTPNSNPGGFGPK